MLDYNVRGENIEITDAIRSYVEKKVNKLDKYFVNTKMNVTARVNLKVYPNKSAKAEVTILLPYLSLRAEETSDDLYKSIDLVIDKLVRQIHKFNTRINRKSRDKGINDFKLTIPDSDYEEEAEDNGNDEMEVVRTKRLALKPMNSQEAILQMNMLDHNFFIFEDTDTDGISIVYKRRDGHYGLIETNDTTNN